MTTPALRLSALLRELNAAGYQTDELTYRKLWEGAVEGHYPAHKVTGRWYFHPANIPAIAATYTCPAASNAAGQPMPLDANQPQCVATQPGDLRCYSIRWACVYTHPQAERWAETNLKLVGYRVWFPTRTIPTKREPAERPLFPRYGFIAFDHRDTSWSPIRNTPGVVDLVRCGALPAYTNAEAVVRLQAAQAFAATSTRNEAQWHLGDAVAPRVGPFAGLPGVVLAVQEENATVGILFLGQLREVVYPFDALVSRDDF